MVPKLYYNYIFMLFKAGAKFIFTGDRNQIPPVEDPDIDFDD